MWPAPARIKEQGHTHAARGGSTRQLSTSCIHRCRRPPLPEKYDGSGVTTTHGFPRPPTKGQTRQGVFSNPSFSLKPVCRRKRGGSSVFVKEGAPGASRRSLILHRKDARSGRLSDFIARPYLGGKSPPPIRYPCFPAVLSTFILILRFELSTTPLVFDVKDSQTPFLCPRSSAALLAPL